MLAAPTTLRLPGARSPFWACATPSSPLLLPPRIVPRADPCSRVRTDAVTHSFVLETVGSRTALSLLVTGICLRAIQGPMGTLGHLGWDLLTCRHALFEASAICSKCKEGWEPEPMIGCVGPLGGGGYEHPRLAAAALREGGCCVGCRHLGGHAAGNAGGGLESTSDGRSQMPMGMRTGAAAACPHSGRCWGRVQGSGGPGGQAAARWRPQRRVTGRVLAMHRQWRIHTPTSNQSHTVTA